jgi:hypothetical protein
MIFLIFLFKKMFFQSEEKTENEEGGDKEIESIKSEDSVENENKRLAKKFEEQLILIENLRDREEVMLETIGYLSEHIQDRQEIEKSIWSAYLFFWWTYIGIQILMGYSTPWLGFLFFLQIPMGIITQTKHYVRWIIYDNAVHRIRNYLELVPKETRFDRVVQLVNMTRISDIIRNDRLKLNEEDSIPKKSSKKEN